MSYDKPELFHKAYEFGVVLEGYAQNYKLIRSTGYPYKNEKVPLQKPVEEENDFGLVKFEKRFRDVCWTPGTWPRIVTLDCGPAEE